MDGVNLLAVAAAAVATFVIGGIWYSPVLFHNAWMSTNRFTDRDLEGGAARIFGVAFILAIVMAVNLAMFLAGPETTASWGAAAGALTGAGWVLPALATIALFERRSWRYIAINGGYWVVAFTVMGVILGAWR